MKKILFVPLFVTSFLLSVFNPVLTQAATFTPNKIIDDTVFDNVDSMTSSQVDVFLNGFSGSCISPNSGFRAIDPIGYNPSSGYQYGGYVTAGQVIADAARAYALNPQVLLVTLEKEQSLVTGRNNFNGYCNNGDQHKYASAVGYGCPDSGTTHNYDGVNLYQRNGNTVSSTGTTCVNSAAKAGFSQQVIRAAWLLKFGQQRARGNINWAVIQGAWNNSDDPQSCYGGPMTQGTWQRCPSGGSSYYDGYTTIDGSAVHIESGGTAALYWYTPHFSGNQNFFNLFNSWFGSTQTTIPFAWKFLSESIFMDSSRTQRLAAIGGRISMQPNQTVYMTVKVYNNGNQVWNNSNVRLGTTTPQDRCSVFANASWLACTRIQLAETTVAPSETGTFNFSITAPNQPGSYNERLSLVVDGTTWMNDPQFYLPIDVSLPQNASNSLYTSLQPGQSLTPGQYLMSSDAHNVFMFQGDGNLVLYSDYEVAWSSGKFNNNASRLQLQTDGNLVAYDRNGIVIWASNTAGNANARLDTQTDGNIVLYGSSGSPLWSTSSYSAPNHLSHVNHSLPGGSMLFPQQTLMTADGKYKLILQRDGNLVLYNATKAIWSSNTTNISSVMLQGDGNLLGFNTIQKLVWGTNTGNQGISILKLQDDGNLVLYNSSGRPSWSSGTYNK